MFRVQQIAADQFQLQIRERAPAQSQVQFQIGFDVAVGQGSDVAQGGIQLQICLLYTSRCV